MSIGKRLKEYIAEKRLTQEEFSKLCQVNKQTISNIAVDKTAPSGEVLAKVAKAYRELNFNWLLTGDGPMFNGDLEIYPDTAPNTRDALLNLRLLLAEKDNVIAAQKDTIAALKEALAAYKQK